MTGSFRSMVSTPSLPSAFITVEVQPRGQGRTGEGGEEEGREAVRHDVQRVWPQDSRRGRREVSDKGEDSSRWLW